MTSRPSWTAGRPPVENGETMAAMPDCWAAVKTFCQKRRACLADPQMDSLWTCLTVRRTRRAAGRCHTRLDVPSEQELRGPGVAGRWWPLAAIRLPIGLPGHRANRPKCVRPGGRPRDRSRCRRPSRDRDSGTTRRYSRSRWFRAQRPGAHLLRRARTAAASSVSTEAVVSKSMHASVTLCP